MGGARSAGAIPAVRRPYFFQGPWFFSGLRRVLLALSFALTVQHTAVVLAQPQPSGEVQGGAPVQLFARRLEQHEVILEQSLAGVIMTGLWGPRLVKCVRFRAP